MKKEKRFFTDFRTAATWQGINLVLCNNVPSIDPSVYENCDFLYDEETEEYEEVYQWYITDISESTKEYQEKTFDINYIYSEVLDCYVLPILHYGTSWDYVECEVFSSQWVEFNQDKLYQH